MVRGRKSVGMRLDHKNGSASRKLPLSVVCPPPLTDKTVTTRIGTLSTTGVKRNGTPRECGTPPECKITT
jgi:hypothetical protein